MAKKITRNQEIYLAPEILGKYENEKPIAIDERTGKQLDPTDINDKIIIYEREVGEWFLNPALELLKENKFNNAFIVLMICMAYFEGVEQYKTGESSNSKSRFFFKNSVKKLYPNLSDLCLGRLYTKSRCG